MESHDRTAIAARSFHVIPPTLTMGAGPRPSVRAAPESACQTARLTRDIAGCHPTPESATSITASRRHGPVSVKVPPSG